MEVQIDFLLWGGRARSRSSGKDTVVMIDRLVGRGFVGHDDDCERTMYAVGKRQRGGVPREIEQGLNAAFSFRLIKKRPPPPAK